MINEQYMEELAEESQKKFPIPEEIHMVVMMTGNRVVMEPFVRQRVLWMLEQAYNKGKNDVDA